jgi:phosphoribosyl-ATP pyrophosphohydrolase
MILPKAAISDRGLPAHPQFGRLCNPRLEGLAPHRPFPASPPMSSVLHQLMSVLEDRKINPPPNSYTARLYSGGDAKIGGKITEEARELVEAAGEMGEPGRRHMIYEASDLIYPAGPAGPSQHQARRRRNRNRPPLRPVRPRRKSLPNCSDGQISFCK